MTSDVCTTGVYTLMYVYIYILLDTHESFLVL